MTPIELFRLYNYIRSIAVENQKFFTEIDVGEYGHTPGDGNAAYIVLQAQEYRKAIQNDTDPAYVALARSEMSRILAICHRECLRLDWDLLDVLVEGIEYERAVIDDIRKHRRPRRSNRALE